MNIRISPNGNLEIERAGKFKTQKCPHNINACCGDWCPRFGEPQNIKGENRKYYGAIDICNRMFTAGYGKKIIDEREK